MNKDTFFLNTIEQAMQDHGCIKQNTIQLIEQDQPTPGDRMYQFKDNNTGRTLRIFFKKKEMTSNEYQWELFIQSENGLWQKKAEGDQTRKSP